MSGRPASVWIVYRGASPFGLGQIVEAVFLPEDKDAALEMAAASMWLKATEFPVTDPAAAALLPNPIPAQAGG